MGPRRTVATWVLRARFEGGALAPGIVKAEVVEKGGGGHLVGGKWNTKGGRRSRMAGTMD